MLFLEEGVTHLDTRMAERSNEVGSGTMDPFRRTLRRQLETRVADMGGTRPTTTRIGWTNGPVDEEGGSSFVGSNF